jgi:hypothetical protein
MEPGEGLFTVIGICFAVFGLVSLLVTLFSASFAESELFNRVLLGRQFARTRANRILLSLFSLLLGCYMGFSSAGLKWPGRIALLLWLPFLVVVLLRAVKSRRAA